MANIDIEAVERKLWNAADNLRANSNHASNEYFLPVMGLLFLRHAYNRFLSAKEEILPTLPTRGGRRAELTKEHFSEKTAIFLQEKAQFDYLVSLPDGADRAKAIIDAMESIEADYASLQGVLPKGEYQELDNTVLGQLLRTLNPEELKRASGDVFGRVYEYFLTQFADQKAHDNGEFFTPVSLVSLIANVIEPDHGIVLDPACGSGGMFVQSAHFVERKNKNPSEELTFRGLEKNPTTIRLGKMNLAVHGLEGDIQKAITYYEDPHELHRKADFVMANPPFNVDEVDADKVKNDPRLPFGLPGVNKAGKVTNGNYLWISYFHSYLNDFGRAGFVMSSQASSAGRDEAKVRRKLVESGDVDIMIAIRSNFFYTRAVPCELWFLNKGKPEEHQDKVLMIDARSIYRKVTRKIYDFSPEHLQNILAIVWLHRGETSRFTELVDLYLKQSIRCGAASHAPLERLQSAYVALCTPLVDRLESTDGGAEHTELRIAITEEMDVLRRTESTFRSRAEEAATSPSLENCEELSDLAKELIRDIDGLWKRFGLGIDLINNGWSDREAKALRKDAESARAEAVDALKEVRYFFRHAHWLTERFPDTTLCDVEGLVKLVDIKEIEANDWSLTPGRYVGVAPEEEDENFDFEEALREIHTELLTLNGEAAELAAQIATNFEELGV